MNQPLKNLTALAMFAALILFPATSALAGGLDSPNEPSVPASAMFTLEDIFNRLESGTPGIMRDGAFREPGAGPAATGRTLNEVMGVAPALDGDHGATVDQVLEGKKFWGLLPGTGWGLLTGTLTTRTPTNTNVIQQAGVYGEFNLSTVDSNLAPGNIRSGVTIFGLAGNFTGSGVDTSSGDAEAGEILAGKKAWVDGVEVTGTMPDRGTPTWTPGTSVHTLVAGYYSGGTVLGDSDLVSGNIRSGMTIFGVAGNFNVVDTSTGDAVAGDILAGKKAWVGGTEVTGIMANIVKQDITPGISSQTITRGYHDGTGSVAGDEDLIADNIKKDVEIFGVTGTLESGGGGFPAPVPRTGQTTCWDASGNVIDCPGTGHDGDLKQGVESPDSRFTDNGNGNGTVTDHLTGLMWTKAAVQTTTNWISAITYCNNLGLGGFSDWNLPNIKQFMSLLSYESSKPTLPSGHPFTSTEGWEPNASWYTSTTYEGTPANALTVNMHFGSVDNMSKGLPLNVWCVRVIE